MKNKIMLQSVFLMILFPSFCLAEDMSSSNYSLDVDTGQVNVEESSSPNYMIDFEVFGDSYTINQEQGYGGGGGGAYGLNQGKVVVQSTVATSILTTTFYPVSTIVTTTIHPVSTIEKVTSTTLQKEVNSILEETTLAREGIENKTIPETQMLESKGNLLLTVGVSATALLLLLALVFITIKSKKPPKKRGLISV